MGIASRQIRWAFDRALERILQSGRMPSLRELFRTLPEVFGPSGIGFPLLRLRPAKPHQVAFSAELTAMIRELRTDLELLFEEHHAQATQILASYDAIASEHQALARRLRELEERIDRLLLANKNTSGYLATAGDRFASLAQVDMARTSAWVDLRAHRVSPPIRRGVSKEYPITPPADDAEWTQDASGLRSTLSSEGATFTIEITSPSAEFVAADRTRALTLPQKALDGKLDTAWVHQVVLTESLPATVRFTIDLGQGQLTSENGQPVPITEIAVSPHARSGSEVAVSITEDGEVWRQVGSETYQSQEELVFTVGRPIRACRVDVTQQAPDNVQAEPEAEGAKPGSGNRPYYEHHIGLKVLSWRVLHYENSGVLVSTALTPKDGANRPTTIARVSLEARESLNAGEIRYSVSPDGEQWFPIVPLHRANSEQEAIVDFYTLSSPRQVTADSASLSADRKVDVFGLSYWKLAELPISPGFVLVPESVEARAGYRQMAMYQYVHQWWTDPQNLWGSVGDHPSLGDWVQLPGGLRFPDDVRLRFVPATTAQLQVPGDQNNLNTRLFVRLRATSTQTITLRLVLLSGAQQVKAVLYHDRQRVDEKLFDTATGATRWEPQVTLPEGTNTLHLLLYAPSPVGTLTFRFGVANGDTTLPLSNIDPELTGADFGITFVAPFELFYQTPEHNYDRIAVDAGTASLYITDMAKQMGLRYLLRYRFRPAQVPTAIYLKAELLKGGALLPPYLHSYLLRVSS